MSTVVRSISENPRLRIARLVKLLVARQRAAEQPDVPWLIAHPEWHPGPASDGERAEYRHLLYDADEDATVPAFVSLVKHRKPEETPGGAR